MTYLVFLLEEPSAREMLKGVLPRILPDDVYPEFKVFEGKQDLEKNIPRVLKTWRRPCTLFVILRDKDAGDCHAVKNALCAYCRESGRADVPVLVRVACRELESFYLGDLKAVEAGLNLSGLARQQKGQKFRNPDRLGNPSEELRKLTSGAYSKVAGSRKIAPHLDLKGNTSQSFNALISGVCKLLSEDASKYLMQKKRGALS